MRSIYLCLQISVVRSVGFANQECGYRFPCLGCFRGSFASSTHSIRFLLEQSFCDVSEALTLALLQCQTVLFTLRRESIAVFAHCPSHVNCWVTLRTYLGQVAIHWDIDSGKIKLKLRGAHLNGVLPNKG